MCKKFFFVFFFFVSGLLVAQELQPSLMINITKLLTLSRDELVSSKVEIKSLRQELATSLQTISGMQMLINQQQKELERASQQQTQRQEASKSESTDSSSIISSLRNLYDKVLTENHDLAADNKRKDRVVIRLIVAVVVLGLVIFVPLVVKILRKFSILPV
jgi:hypothetical protein